MVKMINRVIARLSTFYAFTTHELNGCKFFCYEGCRWGSRAHHGEPHSGQCVALGAQPARERHEGIEPLAVAVVCSLRAAERVRREHGLAAEFGADQIHGLRVRHVRALTHLAV